MFPKEEQKHGDQVALLAAKELIKEPFAVINADDYYAKEAFIKVHNWLTEEHDDNAYSMAGFILKILYLIMVELQGAFAKCLMDIAV